MRKLLFGTTVIILASCGGNPNGTGNGESNGTYAPYTGGTAGPAWHPHSATVSIRDANNNPVASITTDTTGHGSIQLPAATYRIQPVGDTMMLKEHTVMIDPGVITRDTIDFCPWSV
jgi:hypothetical protein